MFNISELHINVFEPLFNLFKLYIVYLVYSILHVSDLCYNLSLHCEIYIYIYRKKNQIFYLSTLNIEIIWLKINYPKIV